MKLFNVFSEEELTLAKKLAYKNDDVGFLYNDMWIVNPFLDSTGRFEFANLDAMCDYYGEENVYEFLYTILASNGFMKITEKIGDLLESNADVLAHQVNCVGVMGAGIARQFKNQMLSDEEFEKYVSLCKEYGDKNLGNVQILKLNNGKYLANLFGENIPTGTEVDTDYDALGNALNALKQIAEENSLSIALPGYMGCGLAGGDWDIVHGMIVRIFGNSNIPTEIIYHPDNVNRLTTTIGML